MSDRFDSLWEESAERYAALAPRISFYRETAHMIVAALGSCGNQRVVDLGCGSPSLVLDGLWARFPEVAEVICVDSSPSMLNELEKHSTHPKTNFLESRAEQIDECLDEKVDAVVCNSAFWHFDMLPALSAIRKSLKPRGRILFTISAWDLKIADVSHDPKYEAIDEVLKERGLPPKPYRGSKIKREVSEVVAALSQTGFLAVETNDFDTRPVPYDYRLFYQIPAIARRTPPHVPLAAAMDILAEAMRRLEGVDLPSLKWVLFRAMIP